MDLKTISQVSREYGVSARMLRYYEQIGLLQSLRKDDYAYRVYDEAAVSRLRQLIILRKLRVPVKQIINILNSKDATETIEIFRQNIHQLDEEIDALSTVKTILIRFVEELNKKANANISLLDDESMFSMINSLSFSNNKIQEVKENLTMDNLNNANERLSKLADRDVRIVYLPPSDVAAYQFVGDHPESRVLEVVNQFVKDSNLAQVKPDLRNFGFNSPNPKEEDGPDTPYGYEMWVTIPDGFHVPAPLVKKRMEGGMYCAHMVPMGTFDEWALLSNWLHASDKYEFRGVGSSANMCDSLEECLNYITHVNSSKWGDKVQLDLLIPIKEK